MINQLSPPIRALILDMDGVLWRGSEPIGDLPAIFESLRSRELKVVFATNNSTKSVAQVQKRLKGFGVEIEPWQVITSAMAAAHLLHCIFPQGGAVYIIGMDGLVHHLEEHGFYHAEENVIAVVAGLDIHFSYEKLRRANNHLRAGARFIATNPDPTFPRPGGLDPGAGSIIAAIQAASQTEPLIAGKPFTTMMEMALERLNLSPEQTLVVGDRLDTDISGGKRAGCRTALVLSGAVAPQELEQWQNPPDLIAPNLTALLEMV
ncbi:MAG: HAD-IIA family hydrolase [Anaerolineaceae bacterium]|nr:HAD-IIA family hydrolase [Anaerolineaceae bacterium]